LSRWKFTTVMLGISSAVLTGIVIYQGASK
jgi:hypothetical protein